MDEQTHQPTAKNVVTSGFSSFRGQLMEKNVVFTSDDKNSSCFRLPGTAVGHGQPRGCVFPWVPSTASTSVTLGAEHSYSGTPTLTPQTVTFHPLQNSWRSLLADILMVTAVKINCLCRLCSDKAGADCSSREREGGAQLAPNSSVYRANHLPSGF